MKYGRNVGGLERRRIDAGTDRDERDATQMETVFRNSGDDTSDG